MNTMRKRPYNNNRNNSGGGGRHRRSNNNSGGGRYNSGQSLARQKQTALQKKENYLNQARDALSSGDRVVAEYYFQHVEHWSRTVGDILAQLNEREDNQNDDADNSAQVDGNATDSADEGQEEVAEAKPARKPRAPRKKAEASDNTTKEDDAEPADAKAEDASGEEEKPKPRRGRKPKAVSKPRNPNANHDETPLPDSVIPQAGTQ